jgi:16S rRNA (guanine966-N2)-methyltransferase
MIRIISGTHKGRRILAPSNLPVRPTTDFAKEALFNILNTRIDYESTRALDIFSGTGNISYELASRGCPKINAVDSDFRCVKFIRETALKFEFKTIDPAKADVFSWLEQTPGSWDLIFADPPFDQVKTTATLPGIIFRRNLLKPGGLLIIEHADRQPFTETERLLECRAYGKVNFSIFGMPDSVNV